MESSRFRFLKMLNFYLEYFRCMLVGHYYNYVRFWMDDFIRNCYIAIFQFLYRIPGRCWNSWKYANNPSYVSNSVLLLLNQDDHNFELPSMRTILNNNNSYIFTSCLFCRAHFNSSPIAQRFLLVKRPFSCQNPNYGSKDCFWISISCSIWQFYDLIQNDFSRRARSVFF